MRKMCFPVVSEQMPAKNGFGLRIVMRKEVKPGIAQQNPVKKDDVERFEAKQH